MADKTYGKNGRLFVIGAGFKYGIPFTKLRQPPAKLVKQGSERAIEIEERRKRAKEERRFEAERRRERKRKKEAPPIQPTFGPTRARSRPLTDGWGCQGGFCDGHGRNKK